MGFLLGGIEEMSQKIPIVFSLFICLPFMAWGQDSDNWSPYKKYKKWFHYSDTKVTPEGEPHLTCLGGGRGNFIVGSRGQGLFRFDVSRRLFEAYPGGERFRHKQITDLVVGQSESELWIGTYFSGLHHRRRNGDWEVFDKNSGMPGSRVICIERFRDSTWVGTDKGLLSFSKGRMTKTGLEQKVESLAFDEKSGRIYAGHSESKISVYDPSRESWSTVKMAVDPPVTFKHLLVEPSGDILVGTFLGLFRIDGSSGGVDEITRDAKKKLISCLTMGADGNVYVGIFGKNKGIHILEGDELRRLFRGYAGFTEANDFARTRQGDYVILSYGRLWHFTDRFIKTGQLKEAVFRGLDKDTESVVPDLSQGADSRQGIALSNLPPPPKPPQSPRTESPSKERDIVSKAQEPSLESTSIDEFTKLLEGEEVLSLAESVGRVWIGTSEGNLYSLSGFSKVNKARSFSEPVSRVFYSAGGELYILLSKRTLYRFNGFSYRKLYDIPAEVTTLIDGKNGGLLIGTTDGVFRSVGGDLSPLEMKGDLPDRSVRVLYRKDDEIWIGTRLGLARILNQDFEVFTTSDGLPSPSIRDLASFRGRTWIATDGGVVSFVGSRFKLEARSRAQALKANDGSLWLIDDERVRSFDGSDWAFDFQCPLGFINDFLFASNNLLLGAGRGLILISNEKFD